MLNFWSDVQENFILSSRVYCVSSVREGANSYTGPERGLVPQGSFVPIMIFNSPTLLQTLLLCKT